MATRRVLRAFRARARLDTASPPFKVVDVRPNFDILEIFTDVVFEDPQRRSQNVGSTGSTLVIRLFCPVYRAKIFDIFVASVPVTAEHLHVAGKGLLRPSCVVNFGEFFPEIQVGLLIPDDRIVRDDDPSVVQSNVSFWLCR